MSNHLRSPVPPSRLQCVPSSSSLLLEPNSSHSCQLPGLFQKAALLVDRSDISAASPPLTFWTAGSSILAGNLLFPRTDILPPHSRPLSNSYGGFKLSSGSVPSSGDTPPPYPGAVSLKTARSSLPRPHSTYTKNYLSRFHVAGYPTVPGAWLRPIRAAS